jgi:hypothetical protein
VVSAYIRNVWRFAIASAFVSIVSSAVFCASSTSPTATQDNAAVGELKQFAMDLYCDGRCGRAAAEYNLVKAGAIEVGLQTCSRTFAGGRRVFCALRMEVKRIG